MDLVVLVDNHLLLLENVVKSWLMVHPSHSVLKCWTDFLVIDFYHVFIEKCHLNCSHIQNSVDGICSQ